MLESNANVRQKSLILLLLLLSGNVQLNPGPPPNTTETPDGFRARSRLSIIHINRHILLPELDLIKIWIQTTDTDIVVLSETWLNKSITDEDIFIKGYNDFSCDHLTKGGGIAIYIKKQKTKKKHKCDVTLLSESIPK